MLFQKTTLDFVQVGDKVVLKKRAVTPPTFLIKKEKQKKASASDSAHLTASVVPDMSNLIPAFTPFDVHTVPVADDSIFNLEALELLEDSVLMPHEKYTVQKTRLLKRYMSKMDSLSKIGDLGSMEELQARFAMSLGRLRYKIRALTDSLKFRTKPLFQKDSLNQRPEMPAQLSFFPPLGTNGFAAPLLPIIFQ